MTLFIVATPIGNLNDFSLRACEILQNVDLILAEDTRHSKKLLQHFNIKKPLLSFHNHNEEQVLPTLVTKLKQQNIALISDAGTPLISDPGFRLVKLAKENNIKIEPIPGACALITALCASGINCDKFSFFGFLPNKNKAKEDFLADLKQTSDTMIFYESPKRVLKTIMILQKIFGGNRICCLARELTKINEQIVTEKISEILIAFDKEFIPLKGEFVILLQGEKQETSVDEIEITRILKILLKSLTLSEAVKATSQITKSSKNEVYKIALKV